MIYNDKTSSFEESLEKERPVSIHTRNMQIFATDMFKVYRLMSPLIICEIFNRREISYNLRNFIQLSVPYVKSVHQVTESISYLFQKSGGLFQMKLSN